MSALSVYNAILDAEVKAVQGLGLAYSGVALPVLKRKLPKVGENLDTVPCVIVCPSEAPEKVVQADAEGGKFVTYGSDLVLVAANNQDQSKNLDTQLSWREQVEYLAEPQTLPPVPGVWMVQVTPGTPIDRAKVSQNYDYSPIGLQVTTREKRS